MVNLYVEEVEEATQIDLNLSQFVMLILGFASKEENTLLKRELERLKLESNTVSSSTNDQLINLRNEVDTLKAKLKVETEARKAAQRLAKELQIKLDKIRIKGAKRGRTDDKEIEEIQVWRNV